MIPDFLQGPRGVPGSTPRSDGSESTVSGDPAAPADDFARTLREQQSARRAERVPPTVPGSSRGSSVAHAASDPASKSPPRGSDQSSARSDVSRSETSHQADAEPRTSAGGRADRAGNEGSGSVPSRSAGGPGSAKIGTDSQASVAAQSVAGRRGVADGADSPESVAVAASRDAGVVPLAAASETLDESRDGVAAGFLVDGFSTQVEVTTATNDGLQLEVDEQDSARAADPATRNVEDNSLDVPVELLLIEPGRENSQPLVLASLVSIAVVHSVKSRTQQSGTGQGGTEQGGEGSGSEADPPAVRVGVLVSGTGEAGGQAVEAGLSVGQESASPLKVETSALPSLVAARHGRPSGRVSPVASTESGIEPPRSQTTPQALTVGLPASRLPVAGEQNLNATGDELASDRVAPESLQSQLPVSAAGGAIEDAVDELPASSATFIAKEDHGTEPGSDTVRLSTLTRLESPESRELSAENRATDRLQNPAEAQTGGQTSEQEAQDFLLADNSTKRGTNSVAEVDPADGEPLVRQSSPSDSGSGRRSQVSVQTNLQTSRSVSHGSAVSERAEGSTDASHPDDSAAAAIGPSAARRQQGQVGSRAVAEAGDSVGATPVQRSRKVSSDGRIESRADASEAQLPGDGIASALSGGSGSDAATVGEAGRRQSDLNPVAASPAAKNEAAVVPVTASDDAVVEQGTGRVGQDDGLVAREPLSAASGSSAASAGESGASRRGDVDSPVIGDPDRFLSSNVQRALSAIQSAADGGSRLRVWLNPAELGSLLVEIDQTPQGIVARLEVGNAAAHRMLVDSLADLQQSLNRNQSLVDRIDVVLNEARTETSRQQREQSQQREQRDGQEQRGRQQHGDAESERRRQRDNDQLAEDSDRSVPGADAA